ncbi:MULTISPECIES: serine hydrolase [unclassified Mesorhizobium]|uniref:serine hydrolase n=1 Tax=unclassified Mesorhizobium TaxID=325217 RepID=UPI0024781DBC|nr:MULTISPECIES: serine hydrolase [unclassified Mesorhizobium]
MDKCSYLVAFSIAVLTSSGSIAKADGFAEKAQASFEPVVKEYDIPGLVVGVTRNGKHEFFAVGLASRADNRPATPDTLFELGSISKIFNATLAALAEERGKLSLSDTVAHSSVSTDVQLATSLHSWIWQHTIRADYHCRCRTTFRM